MVRNRFCTIERAFVEKQKSAGHQAKAISHNGADVVRRENNSRNGEKWKMNLVSFDLLRTLPLPNVTYIKPDHFFRHIATIQTADWVLFPEYWQVNALVFGLETRIFPSLSSYLVGHDKIEMTRAFMTVAPENVPFTMISANTPVNADAAWERMAIPFVAKIPKSSMGEGVFLIESRAEWERYLEVTPAIFAQEYLPIDRDMRIVVVGHHIVGGFWRLQSERGFYNNISLGGKVDLAPIPDQAVQLVERLAKRLKINHAGFDIALVDQHPYVLEFNRLFGNHSLNMNPGKVADAIMEYLMKESGQNDPIKPLTPMTPKPILPKAA